MSQNASPPAAPPGRSKLVWILLVLVTAVAAGGAGAYWMYIHRGHPDAPPPTPAMVNFDPFVVNLADAGGSRFLRVTLRLVVPDEHKAKALADNEVARMRVRSAVLELLTLQTAAHLVTPEGKVELKKSIAERAEQASGEAKVIDVLFSEFVVQF